MAHEHREYLEQPTLGTSFPRLSLNDRDRYHADKEMGILLMGVTGHGKSATGNAIIGRDAFVSEGGWGSVTKTYHVGMTRVGERIIKVVDIPGFADSDEKSSDDKLQLVVNSLTSALQKFPNGFHAVLLVISYSQRLTKEVKDTLKFIFDKFDKNAFKQNGVLVVTSGDAFHRDNKKRAKSLTLREWLENNFAERLDACGGRCVLFDNVTDDEKVKENQLMELLGEIESMDNGNALYIPKVSKYKGTDENRDAFEKDRKRRADIEEVSSLLGLLVDGFNKAKMQPLHLQKETMDQLSQDIVSLKEKLNKTDLKQDEKILDQLKCIEDDIKHSRIRGEMASPIGEIQTVQNEIDEENEWGPWLENTVKGVSDFVGTFSPALGAGIEAVSAGVRAGWSALSWLFGS